MAEARRIEESVEEFGQFVIDSINAISSRQTEGMDVQRLAEGADHLEFDIAIPFHVKLHVNPDSQGRQKPPGTVCCTCTRGDDGTVRCWGADTACC